MCHLQLLYTFRILVKYWTNRSQSRFKNGRFYLNALYMSNLDDARSTMFESMWWSVLWKHSIRTCVTALCSFTCDVIKLRKFPEIVCLKKTWLINCGDSSQIRPLTRQWRHDVSRCLLHLLFVHRRENEVSSPYLLCRDRSAAARRCACFSTFSYLLFFVGIFFRYITSKYLFSSYRLQVFT